VVDDDPDNLALATAWLEQMGFEVATATDGAAGLQLALDLLPDLCVLDFRMPELHGNEVIARLRGDSRSKGVAILILSASVRQAEIDEGLLSGADGYLRKPYTREKLREAVEAAMAAHRTA
jgi:CheY-like chemotaxis protein